MIKRIVVSRHWLQENAKTGKRLPVFAIHTEEGITDALRVDIDGPSALLYQPDEPMPQGQVAWIETSSPVRWHDGETSDVIH